MVGLQRHQLSHDNLRIFGAYLDSFLREPPWNGGHEQPHSMAVKWRIRGSTVGPDGEGRRNSNNKLAESITLRKVKHSRQTQKLT